MYGQEMGFSNVFCGSGGFMPGPLGMILTILFWVIIISIVVRIFQFLFSKTSYTKTQVEPDALELLDKRYASGEINEQEYRSIKKDIS